jgi:hypothetical protein
VFPKIQNEYEKDSEQKIDSDFTHYYYSIISGVQKEIKKDYFSPEKIDIEKNYIGVFFDTTRSVNDLVGDATESRNIYDVYGELNDSWDDYDIYPNSSISIIVGNDYYRPYVPQEELDKIMSEKE